MSHQNNVQPASRLRSRTARCWTVRLTLFITILLAATQAVLAQTSMLQGTVSVSSTNGAGERLPGASLKLTPASSGQPSRSAVTNEQGEYKFTDLTTGIYTLQIDLTGFKQQTKTVTLQKATTAVENINLELEGLTADITVVADGEGLNTTPSGEPVSFKQDKLQTVPLVNEQFQDAIPLVPGVVRGPDGLLNLKGARASQSGFLVNSANVTDPVTGESAINLPLEAVQSVEVVANPYAAEYGQFTGAVTTVQTKSGSDKFNVNAQSMFPRIRRRGGAFVGIAAFTPRVTFSGPIIKDKLKFMQSFEYRFVRTPVENLPPLKRDTGLESFDSVSQLDWDINDRHHLSTTFSLFPQKLRYVNLNTFNPQEVTPNFKQRGFLWAMNERAILNSKSVLESSFSIKQFDADIFPSSGIAPMNFAPNVNSGNFFNQQYRKSRRLQALEVYSFSPSKFVGEHFMKVGGGINYVTFDGRNTSNSVRILRADGTRNQQFDFVGSGQLSRNQTQFLGFFEDTWTLNRRLKVDYGMRYDRNNVTSENNLAPRVGFAFLPLLDGSTVVRGGIGLFYDDVDMNVATFTQLQDRVLTRFGPDGEEIVGVPQIQRLALLDSKLRTPHSVNWNIQVDREWIKNLFVRVGYQQRQGRREFVLNPIENQETSSILALDNSGSSRYRELEVTAKYNFREHDEFIASYVRSSAIGDLNDFNSYFGNFENPIIRANERSRLPFDSPNRFLFRSEFQAKYGITLAPVLDVRTGFPFSLIDEERNFVGPRNRAGRFPTFVSLDMQVLKTIRLPGPFNKYRAHLGFKVFNLTNHFNPRDFQNNLASDSFGNFSNGVGRKFGTRISFSKK
jgi:Carboxypeptidase regulatory-like domain/TonB dependent receptor/TonB-dependent Receptor Plug Domain